MGMQKRSCSLRSGGVQLLLFCSVLLWDLHFSSGQTEGDVRLVGGTSYQGTVEVFHSGQWGTICDDSWHLRDANVICRQLGFVAASRVWYRAYYGSGQGPIWVDQIQCPEDGTTILDCNPNWGVHDCRKSEDAGVDCLRIFPVKPASMPVRVSCPDCVQWGSCSACPGKRHPAPKECSTQIGVQGIVFAQYNNKWFPVTSDEWDIKDSQVVCAELGYPFAHPPPSLATLWTNWDGSFLSRCGKLNGLFSGPTYPACEAGQNSTSSPSTPLGSGSNDESQIDDGLCTSGEIKGNDEFRKSLNKTLLKGIRCEGFERRLLDCYFPSFGPYYVEGLKVATVSCSFAPHESCPGSSTEEYRLRGGPVPWEGRVEVKVDGKWGTICDNQWDEDDANVVCKALGYGAAEKAYTRAYYGRGVGSIHYTHLGCVGNEPTLSACRKTTGVTAEACGHIGDAGLRCVAPTLCPIPQGKKIARFIQLASFEHPTKLDSYIEVTGSNGPGLLCVNDIRTQPFAANVLCKSEHKMFVGNIRSGKAELYSRSARYGAVLDCKGKEMSLEECQVTLSPLRNCRSQGGEAIVDCSEGAPDLVPDLDTLYRSIRYVNRLERSPLRYLRCAQEENCLSSSAENQDGNHLRSLLRFDSLTMNWGKRDFLPHLPSQSWQYHTCHNHYHSFEAFIHYDLLNFTTGNKVAEGHKASFCLEDSICRGNNRGFGCGTGVQGISVNCGDLYSRYLDCQWIDVTDVRPGLYLLRLTVNPDNFVVESDHRNNDLTCVIELKENFGMKAYTCKLSDH